MDNRWLLEKGEAGFLRACALANQPHFSGCPHTQVGYRQRKADSTGCYLKKEEPSWREREVGVSLGRAGKEGCGYNENTI